MCVNCGRVAMSECTGCHKVNYCSTFCQRKVRLTWTILWSKVQFFKKLKYPFQECRRNTKDVANVVNPSYCFKSYPFFLFVCFGVGSFFFLLLNQWQFGISKTRHQFVCFFSTAGLEGSSTHLLSVCRGRCCSGGRANHSHGHGQSEMK